MKKTLFTIVCALPALMAANAQDANPEAVQEESPKVVENIHTSPDYATTKNNSNFEATGEDGLVEAIAKIEKKTSKFNLYLNMHSDFAATWTGSHFQNGKFEMKQLRIEALGRLNDWLTYRYRQRLNKGDDNKYYDNVLGSIDIAGIGLNFGKWQAFIGKQCAAYGGIQFDENPIEVYQYCDMIDYMSNFMTGIQIGYNFTPNQQLNFQMLNSLTNSSEDMYGHWEKSKMPMVYTLNWNGQIVDVPGFRWNTRWSASYMTEVKGKHMQYYALGNQFTFSPTVGAFVDWMYSREGVDRKGIMTQIVGEYNDYPGNDANVCYNSTVAHFNWRFNPRWNWFAEGMYETAGQTKDARSYSKGNYRTTWTWLTGIEFYPFRDRTLHFFATYVGQAHRYSSRAVALGNSNNTTSRLSVGFIWQMPVF